MTGWGDRVVLDARDRQSAAEDPAVCVVVVDLLWAMSGREESLVRDSHRFEIHFHAEEHFEGGNGHAACLERRGKVRIEPLAADHFEKGLKRVGARNDVTGANDLARFVELD